MIWSFTGPFLHCNRRKREKVSAFNVGLVVESSGNSCMIASIFSAEAQGGDGEK